MQWGVCTLRAGSNQSPPLSNLTPNAHGQFCLLPAPTMLLAKLNLWSEMLVTTWCRCQCQWPRSLRHGCGAICLLGLWVRIPTGKQMPVCCECWVLSGRGLCDGLITRPELSYRLWCVCDRAASLGRCRLTGGCRAMKRKIQEVMLLLLDLLPECQHEG